MPMQNYPPNWNQGKANLYGQNNTSHIQSGVQYYNPVKEEAAAIKNCFNKTLYYMNRWVRDKVLISLDSLAELLTVDAPEAYLRNGYLVRRFGKVYVFQTPKMPDVGGVMAPIRHHIQPIYEDVSGKEWCQMSAAIDSYKYEFREAFQDISEYSYYWNQKSSQISDAFVRAINALVSVIVAASFGFTLTTDAFVTPFFNSDAVPTEQESAAAKKFYDQNEFFFKYMKDEVIPQIQEKFTNKVYYIGDFYSPFEDSIEITECSEYQLPENGIGESIKKIYFKKDGSKQKTPDGMNRHTSLVGLFHAFDTQMTAMTEINSVANMAFYKPYQKTKQTNAQDADKLLASRGIAVFNAFDLEEGRTLVARTSPTGNYSTNSIVEKWTGRGMQIRGHHAVPPGCVMIREFGFLQILKVLIAMYMLDHPYILAETIGGHQWIKVVMTKFTPAVDLIPTKFVPSQFYLTNQFNTLKVA